MYSLCYNQSIYNYSSNSKIDSGKSKSNWSDVSKAENGKIFLHDALDLTSAEISINCVPKGFKTPFNHKHIQNEEIYIFLKGEGILTIDNEKINVEEGTSIKVSPKGCRILENIGKESLQFICIQAKADSLEQFGFADAKLC